MQTYTPDEIRIVLRAADKDRNGHLWYLALSGLRRGEIAGLKWSDIDVDRGHHHHQPAAGFRQARQLWSRTNPKRMSSRRTLPLDDGLISRAQAGLGALRAGEAGARRGARGQRLRRGATRPVSRTRPTALTRMWHRLTKAAGVRPIRLHDARHSCGTALHLRGVPMAVIAKWLGHADASITARIYAHSQDDALRAAGVTLGQVVTADG